MTSRLPLISVITPSLNSAPYLERAIGSVLIQRYPNFEHIVVDGGSRDGTVAILRRHDHLRWVSGTDLGQSDAMNKGFAMANGDVIVYLNTDDYFEPNAFRAIVEHFLAGAMFVVGRVKVIGVDGLQQIDDPKVDISEMLKWWRPNAFPCNPVGYFYRREVLASIGHFSVDDHYTMDFEFLLEAARRYEFTKIPDVLGCFFFGPGTKTYDNPGRDYEVFLRFEKYLSWFDDDYRLAYLEERTNHYRGLQRARLLRQPGMTD